MLNGTQDTASSQDRRGALRQQVKAEAILSFDNISVNCTVRNISSTGVVVFLPKWYNIPDDVDFMLVGEEAVRPAAVVRRLAPNIALHFRDSIV